MRHVPSSREALEFIKANGIVLESAHGRVPTFVDFVVGDRLTRWWDHPLGRSIFKLTRVIRDSPDVLTCRLIDGKVTYVHHRLWPALVKLSKELNKNDLGSIKEEHLPTGKHRIIVTAFPDWVPQETIEKSERLDDLQAELLLRSVLSTGQTGS
jgi:hypothetical protein